ncbi:Imidazolonepropionase [Flavobacterium aquidurense]|uniref:Amidohydrolase n=1 Tax=Flavobacterium frigidimaris TaxID=262320 RepID=A0ABX4BWG0_FLAFR|nr:amidohydrolase family protein [Flavobacterium frigidimaris]OXA82028.1 amidohydrolase [Flavobacterium frigidimaris]SDY56743.1 Imidazolonepropionase [Flavobacterium aquidurense]
MTYRNYYYLSLLLFILTILMGCSNSKHLSCKNLPNEDVLKNETYAIRNVNIITMTTDNKVIKNATLVIKENKIFSINGTIPEDAKIIDAKNKWLIPGLVDMHVHNLADINFASDYPTKGATLFSDTQDFMLLYIANGVTTVLELSARVEHFGQRNEIIKQKVIGPRIALAFLIDGGDGSGNIANTPEDGRQSVRIAKAQGYEFIKVYSGLNIETYKAIVDEALKNHMKVVGHIPNAFKGRLEQAFVPNFDMIAHAEELSKQSKDLRNEDAQRFAKLAKENGTWLTPTLTTMQRIAEQTHSLDGIRNLPSLKYVHPLMQSKWLYSNHYNNETDPKRIARIDSMVDFHFRLVKAFKDAEVPIVAGTDSGVSGVVWGWALHDELELLVKAGLTNQEALASATRLPALWLGIEDKTGTIEVGKYADLILLDANPLDDISNTRMISGVFVNGQWIDKKVLDKMLLTLEKKNSCNLGKDQYNWKKRKAY